MAQVTARTERAIDAPPDQVRAALADYQPIPRIVTETYGDYRVEADGQGVAAWTRLCRVRFRRWRA